MKNKIFTIPTILTLVRLIVSPLTLPLLLVYLLPLNTLWINSSLAFLFTLFGLTDFFDGYLARRLRQETLLGRLLDPLADKFLLFSTLIALVTVQKIWFFWAIIFIGREFFVMGIRQIALENGVAVRVSWWGKIKTVVQMVYVIVVIANPYTYVVLTNAVSDQLYWQIIHLFTLSSALFLTVFSGWKYYKILINALQKKHDREHQTVKASVVDHDEQDI